jgi:hypothetical protein
MKKALFLLALALSCLSVSAQTIDPDNPTTGGPMPPYYPPYMGAVSTSASSSSSNAAAYSGGNTQTATQISSQANSVTVTGDTVTYQAQERNPVSTAYAPNVMPTAACALGTSFGLQAATFGVSFGNGSVDANCQLLEQVRSVATVLNDKQTAAEMMCEVPSYRAARQRLGKPCQ